MREYVFKIRNKRTGEWAYCYEDAGGWHFECWVNAGEETAFTQLSIAEHMLRQVNGEIVRFTLSDPEVVDA